MNLIINYYSVSLFIGGFTALLSGIIVFLTDRKSFTNKSWLLLNISSAIWSFGYFSMIISKNYNTAYLSNVILHFGAIYIPLFYLLFILGITKKFDTHKRLVYGASAIAFIFTILNPTYLYIDKVLPKFIFNFAPNAGPTYIYFTLYFFAVSTLGALILYEKIKEISDIKEITQLKQILFSSIFGFIGGGSVFFITFNVDIPPYPIVFFAFYPITIAYAIIRYGLFNVKLILTESLVFLLWIIISIKAVIAQNTFEQMTDIILLISIIVLGIFLIKSVVKEVNTREEVERLAKNLTEANDRLKELDQMKTEFLSLASHQLRSPLTAIKGYASLLLDGSFGKMSDETKSAVDKIFQASQALVIMVEDFLSISRIEQGRMKYDFSSTDIRNLIATIIQEQMPSVSRAGLTISFNCNESNSYFASVDPGKMRQVITNLIDNSIKYTPKGSILITLTKDSNKKELLISIKDTGVGIDKETLPQLFEKFSRAKEASRVNVLGTGLGLYLAREIVHAHSGKIWVESKGRGEGSTFYVKISSDTSAEHSKQINEFANSI